MPSSRKCTVKIYEVMLSNAYKLFLRLHFLRGPSQNGSGGSGLEQYRGWKLFWTDSSSSSNGRLFSSSRSVTRAVRTDDNVFQSDRLSRSNGYRIFGKSFSQVSVISCNSKFAEFVFAAFNPWRYFFQCDCEGSLEYDSVWVNWAGFVLERGLAGFPQFGKKNTV